MTQRLRELGADVSWEQVSRDRRRRGGRPPAPRPRPGRRPARSPTRPTRSPRSGSATAAVPSSTGTPPTWPARWAWSAPRAASRCSPTPARPATRSPTRSSRSWPARAWLASRSSTRTTTRRERGRLTALATSLDLISTGGSDDHGTFIPSGQAARSPAGHGLGTETTPPQEYERLLAAGRDAAVTFFFQAFVTLFVIIDPPGIVPVFLGLTRGRPSVPGGASPGRPPSWRSRSSSRSHCSDERS